MGRGPTQAKNQSTIEAVLYKGVSAGNTYVLFMCVWPGFSHRLRRHFRRGSAADVSFLVVNSLREMREVLAICDRFLRDYSC